MINLLKSQQAVGGDTNTAPTVGVDTPWLSNKAGSVSLSAVASDDDGDTLTYSRTQNSGTAVTNAQGFDSATPSFNTPDDVESLQFTVSVSDGQTSRSAQLLVVVTEDASTAVFVDGDNGSDTTGDGSIANPYGTISFALGASDGRGADGGRGRSGTGGGSGGGRGEAGGGGRGGAGGGGPSIGVYVGPGLSPLIRENTLVTGDGGDGGDGGFSGAAGRGGIDEVYEAPPLEPPQRSVTVGIVPVKSQ